jgi:hypothetical protein
MCACCRSWPDPRTGRRSRRWRAAAGAALLVGAASSGGAAAQESFALTITGAEGTRYAGQCTLTTAAGARTLEISGIVPRRQELEAEAVACRIESAGLIAVEITGDGSRSRSVIRGGTAHVTAR